MGLTSLQVCMDSSDWLQQADTAYEEYTAMDSSSSSLKSEDNHPMQLMITCTGSSPILTADHERKIVRPQHDEALKCPRCDSTHTKFCYYNNYSLSQPRYFCKSCRRYWTEGGILRNIPVGGGCRKNKKAINTNNNARAKKSSSSSGTTTTTTNDHDHNLSTNLQLSIDSHFTNPNLLDNKFDVMNQAGMVETNMSTRPIDFMGNNEEMRMDVDHDHGLGDFSGVQNLEPNFHGFYSNYGFCSNQVLDHGINDGNYFMDTCHRFTLPYDNLEANDDNLDQFDAVHGDVKPISSMKMLRLDDDHHHHQKDQWQEQGYGLDGGLYLDSFGYNLNNNATWSGVMNGTSHGSSTTNPLV